MNKRTKRIIDYIRYLITIILILSIGYYFLKNKNDISNLVNNIEYVNIIFIVCFIFLSLLIKSKAFYTVIKRNYREISWFDWFKVFIAGSFLNAHFPQLGNIYKVAILRKKYNYSIKNYFISFSAYNWFSVCFYLILGNLTLIILGDFQDKNELYLIITMLTILVIFIILPFFLDHIFNITKKIRLPNFITDVLFKIHIVVKEIKQTIFNFNLISKTVPWIFLQFISIVLMFYFAFRCLNFNLGLLDTIPFVIFNNIIGLVSIVPGNIGIIEYTMGFVGQQYNLPMSDGIFLMLIIRMSGYIVYFLILIPFLIHRIRNHWSLKIEKSI